MKIIIAGSRDFNDYEFLSKKCDEFIPNPSDNHFLLYGISTIQIVSGGCRGADMLGEKYAKENGYSIKRFPADWNRFGKSAGYKRNEEMAKYADALIAFWDGKSKGTKHMIDLANKHNLHITIVTP